MRSPIPWHFQGSLLHIPSLSRPNKDMKRPSAITFDVLFYGKHFACAVKEGSLAFTLDTQARGARQSREPPLNGHMRGAHSHPRGLGQSQPLTRSHWTRPQATLGNQVGAPRL